MSSKIRRQTVSRDGGARSGTLAVLFRRLIFLAALGGTVFSGAAWAGDGQGEVSPADVVTSGPGARDPLSHHRFSVVESDVDHLMECGERAQFEVVIRNDGDLVWNRDRTVRVAYGWRRVGGDQVRRGVRTDFSETVPPGATARLTATVEAPESPGFYIFQWDMVEEHVAWFSRTDPTPAPRLFVVVVPLKPLAFLVLLTILTLIAMQRRRKGRALPAFMPPETDLYWLVLALVLKQHWAMVSSGWSQNFRGVLVGVAISVFTALLLLVLSQRLRPWITWAVNALFSVLLCADVVFVRFFDDLPSFAVFGAAEQTGQVADSILSLFQWTDLWFFIDFVPAFFLMRILSRQILGRRRKLTLAVAGVVLLVPGIWAVKTTKWAKNWPRFQYRSHLEAAEDLGVLGYHASSAFGSIRKLVWGVSISEEDWRLVVEVLEERRPQRAGGGALFGTARGYNLVMIQVESLQGQLLGLEIEGQEVTPALNRLADEGVSFALCVDQTAYGRTSDAEMASQASILPDSAGPAVFRHAGNGLVGLASVLGQHDYSTMVAVPFHEGFWNRSYSHPAFGFEQRLYDGAFDRQPVVGWGLNDRDFLRQAFERIEVLPEPWYAYLITLSNHHPYAEFPEEFEILKLAHEPEGPVLGYLHSMRWADEAIAGFLAALERSGLAERTIVVVFGDHGAALRKIAGDSTVMAFGSTKAKEVLNGRVPLLIRIPGDDAPKGEVGIPVGLVDLPPTLTALLGIDPADLPWLGRNLAGSPGDGPVTVGGRVWVDGRHIFHQVGDGKCYDRFTTERVDSVQCESGAAEVDRLRRANQLILEGDLQHRLRTHLERGTD